MIGTADLVAVDEVTVHVVQLCVASSHISPETKGCLLAYLRVISQLMRLWYLSHRQPVKAQASLHIRAVLPEPSLFAHMKYGSK